jgi:hypothetical protein
VVRISWSTILSHLGKRTEVRVWQYRIAGLSVASEIQLPATTAEADRCDVLIRRAALSNVSPSSEEASAGWVVTSTSCYFDFPEVGRFLVCNGNEIRVEIRDPLREVEAAIYIVGKAIGALLLQRGHFVLHASAVAVDGEAVLFCGPSGAGKSTLAAALVNEGYGFVSDDACHIGFDEGGRPRVFSEGRALKLWPDSLDKLGFAGHRGPEILRIFDKYYVPLNNKASTAFCPLAAIYALNGLATGESPVISKPNLLEMAMILRESAYWPGLVHLMNMEEHYFNETARLLNNASVFHLTRPVAFPKTPCIIRRLEAHWRQLGVISVEKDKRAPQ